MNYRHPVLPWITAAMFFGAAAVFGVLAWYGLGPRGGIAWAITSPLEAVAGIIVVLAIKLQSDPAKRDWYWFTFDFLRPARRSAKLTG
jgi:hypothetical protein